MNQAELLTESPGVQGPTADRPLLAAAVLALQAAMYTVTAIEAAAIAAVTGNAAGSGPVILSLALVGALFWFGQRLNRFRRRARVLEGLLLGWAGIDLAIAIYLNGTGLGLLPTLTRIGIPVAIITLLSPRWER